MSLMRWPCGATARRRERAAPAGCMGRVSSQSVLPAASAGWPGSRSRRPSLLWWCAPAARGAEKHYRPAAGLRGPGGRVRGGLVVPRQPRHRALAGLRGPGRGADIHHRRVRRCRAAMGGGAGVRARGRRCSRRAHSAQHRPRAGGSARVCGGAAAAAVSHHEPEVRWRQGREVRAQGQGRRARRRGGPAGGPRVRRRGRTGAAGGRPRGRPRRPRELPGGAHRRRRDARSTWA